LPPHRNAPPGEINPAADTLTLHPRSLAFKAEV